MKTFNNLVILFLVLVFPFASNATLKDQMLADLDIIKNSFEVRYAPAEWKKTYTGWDLSEQIQNAKNQVLQKQTISVKEYQQILKNFFNSTKDYHVSPYFFSTEVSFLPFRIQSAEGRYFATWVDQQAAPEGFSAGDEIIAFGDLSMDEAFQQFKKESFGNPDSHTDQCLAEMFMTIRAGVLGHTVPQGPVTITVIPKKGSTITKTYDFLWTYSPEEIQEGPVRRGSVLASINKLEKKRAHDFYAKSMHAPFADTVKKLVAQKQIFEDSTFEKCKAETEARLIQEKKGFLPPLGLVVWQTPEDYKYYAYIFKTPDQRNIGFIRIPHYMEDNEGAMEFAKILKIFESKTDALIIDQLNNSGGIVLYMYSLASMLANYPLQVAPHKVSLTQADVAFALEEMKAIENIDLNDEKAIKNETGMDNFLFGYPVTSKFLQGIVDNCRFLVSQWNSGHSITDPGYIFGIEALTQHPSVCYTKPVLVLVNSMSISCGDFFPALLQDNKRATILGTRTAGAGGYVLYQSHPNRLGVAAYSITGSIAERSDKSPIENLGVTPDITYEVTSEDLTGGYSGFAKTIKDTLQTILPPKPKPKSWF